MAANATVTNSGTNLSGGIQAQTFGGGNATIVNSGTNFQGIFAVTFAGGNATVTNSGTNVSNGIQAQTVGGGNATIVNSGSVNGGIAAETFGGGNVTATNSGSNTGGINTLTTSGNITVTNSGSNTGGINTASMAGAATVTNSGSTDNISTSVGSNATVTNSGSVGGMIASSAGNIATVTNSGKVGGGIFTIAGSNATVINSGVVNNPGGVGGTAIAVFGATATLTNIVGGRVIGAIDLSSGNNTVNFQGGNWLFTVTTAGGPTTINAGGAPFVVSGSFANGAQVAVLDPTTFALADRSLTNFTGEISEMLQGRFAGMAVPGAGGAGALGFAPSESGVADQAQAAFAGIPTVAMSYASNPGPVLGKAPAAGVPYYDTTIWASGFGGERKQHADGDILPTTDTAFGGAMGVDRALGGNLRLGAFVGAGTSREAVELNVQTIDATYVFGGAYGRFDWVSQYLDFSLYGGGINNKSTRQVANNTVASGLETATASYGGWLVSPEVIYGYRIPFNAITVSPRVRLRYVGGELDGYSESGSMQNLSVGRRSINDIEERGEVEFATVSGGFKGTASIGVIGLERLGNPTINTVLLSQSLSFTTPGRASAVGGVLGLGVQYRALPNVKLFLAGEGVAMSDKSDSFAASGGAQVSF